VVWGAAYTDVNARLPLMTFEAGAGVVLAGGLIANIWIRRMWLPLAAAGIFVAMLVLGQIYPAAVQGFLVTPNAQSYELPYIEREISGTRAAYGLSNVSVRNFTGDQPLTAQAVQSDSATIDNLRLWDFSALQDTYAQQQGIRLYYTFHDIDIDRYTVNGQYQQLEISAREIDTAKLSAIVGHPGEQNGAVYKITVGRDDLKLTEMGAPITARMGLNTSAAFVGSNDNAAIAGDVAMLATEVTPVLKALRDHGIDVVAIHHHMIGTQPTIFFLHYWATGQADTLAAGFRAALDQLGREHAKGVKTAKTAK